MKFSVSEYQEIKANLVIPVIRAYQEKRAKYFDTSKYGNFQIEEGISKGEGFIDADGLRKDKDLIVLLQRLYKSSNELRDLLTGLRYFRTYKIIEILKKEMDEIE